MKKQFEVRSEHNGKCDRWYIFDTVNGRMVKGKLCKSEAIRLCGRTKATTENHTLIDVTPKKVVSLKQRIAKWFRTFKLKSYAMWFDFRKFVGKVLNPKTI